MEDFGEAGYKSFGNSGEGTEDENCRESQNLLSDDLDGLSVNSCKNMESRVF
jgi:hypothetical protein